MDPLSGVASVIAVLQLAGAIVSICYEYRSSVRDATKSISRISHEIGSLQEVLKKLVDLLEAEESKSQKLSRMSITQLLTAEDGPLAKCTTDLAELQVKLTPQKGWKVLKQTLQWPLKEDDVKKILARLDRSRSLLELALTVDQTTLLLAIEEQNAETQSDLKALTHGIASIQIDTTRENILRWLSAPDPSSNHNAACRVREPSTGEWFTEGSDCWAWRHDPNSFLWLHGIPGCGKTVLCSTIVQRTLEECDSRESIGVGYYYFDFGTSEKQNTGKAIRSLVAQFSAQSNNTPDRLRDHYKQCREGVHQANEDVLISVLKDALCAFEDAYIIIDALDECTELQDFLKRLRIISEWNIATLHILVTSRKEIIIERALTSLVTMQIDLQSNVVNKDIHTHVLKALKDDPDLSSWPIAIQHEISSTLMEKANGMFRWVACQLDVLRRCLKLSSLRNALMAMPRDLDSTYQRIIDGIDKEYVEDATNILRFLAYAARPVSIEEVAEITTIDLSKTSCVDTNQRLNNPRHVLLICSSLVATSDLPEVIENPPIGSWDNMTELRVGTIEVRLAHFSVKEWLMSDRSTSNSVPLHNFSLTSANDVLAQSCLAYLLHFTTNVSCESLGTICGMYRNKCGRRELVKEDPLKINPLLDYAVRNWFHHMFMCGIKGYSEPLREIFSKLFASGSLHLDYLSRMLCAVWTTSTNDMMGQIPAAPLYWMAYLGLHEQLRFLIERGDDVNEGPCCALHAALSGIRRFQFSHSCVCVLVDAGADIECTENGTTVLETAIGYDTEDIVELLLDMGADANRSGNIFGHLARWLRWDHSNITGVLIDRGADVNMVDDMYGSPLRAFILNHVEVTFICELLLAGANVNAQTKFGTALQAAVSTRKLHVVELLLENGADVEMHSDEFGNALHAAVVANSPLIVKMLLEWRDNLDMDAESDIHGTLLQEAAFRAAHNLVSLLIFHGADMNKKTRKYDSAIFAAILGHSTSVDKPDSPHSMSRCELKACAFAETVEKLCGHGAQLDEKDRHGWTALECARAYGHERMCRAMQVDRDEQIVPSYEGHYLPEILVATQKHEFKNAPGGIVVVDDCVSPRILERCIQARGDHCIPLGKKDFYFEVTILDAGDETIVGIGICAELSKTTGMPGWNRNSWGYHGDDGKYFEEEEYIVPYGPLYGAGDTVGCGINLVEQTLFFTCNGERLDTLYVRLRGRYFPVFGTGEENAKIQVNFGATEFCYKGDHGDSGEQADLSTRDELAKLTDEERERGTEEDGGDEHHGRKDQSLEQ